MHCQSPLCHRFDVQERPSSCLSLHFSLEFLLLRDNEVRFQKRKRKDRDSRQRAAIAAKSRKMTEFFEEAACKNKESCSSTTAYEKNRTVEEVEQNVYEVETAYSTVLDYTAPYPTDPALFAARPTDSMLVRSIVLHDVWQAGLNDNFSRGQG